MEGKIICEKVFKKQKEKITRHDREECGGIRITRKTIDSIESFRRGSIESCETIYRDREGLKSHYYK